MGARGGVPPAPSQSSLPTFGPLGIATGRGHLTLERAQGLVAIQCGLLTGIPQPGAPPWDLEEQACLELSRGWMCPEEANIVAALLEHLLWLLVHGVQHMKQELHCSPPPRFVKCCG